MRDLLFSFHLKLATVNVIKAHQGVAPGWRGSSGGEETLPSTLVRTLPNVPPPAFTALSQCSLPAPSSLLTASILVSKDI